MGVLYGQKPLRAFIHVDGEDAGIVQMMERGAIGGLLQAITLDRGPLWFPGFGTPQHVEAFWTSFNARFPTRMGRMRRIIPECEDTPDMRAALAGAGMRLKKNREGYQTVWVDVREAEEIRRAALKPSWRNKLAKAESAGLSFSHGEEKKHLPWFLKIHALDKARRGYPGPDTQFLGLLANAALNRGNLFLFRAVREGEYLAAALFFRHGTCATSQAAWISAEGRSSAAYHGLLWHAFAVLKERGVSMIDMGGVNDASAAGVKTFKEGLGGRTVRLVGSYA